MGHDEVNTKLLPMLQEVLKLDKPFTVASSLPYRLSIFFHAAVIRGDRLLEEGIHDFGEQLSLAYDDSPKV